MGAGRSLEKLRVQSGGKAGMPRRFNTLAEWSARFNWQESARAYDEQVSYITIQEATERHRADLEAHRKEAMDSGRVLLQLANGLARTLSDALQQPRTIKGEDGRTYTLHKVVADGGTLTTIGRAYTAALDLKAHALGVETLLSQLDTHDSE